MKTIKFIVIAAGLFMSGQLFAGSMKDTSDSWLRAKPSGGYIESETPEDEDDLSIYSSPVSDAWPVLILLAGGYWLLKRRRAQASGQEE
jgi:hypothetical protein